MLAKVIGPKAGKSNQKQRSLKRLVTYIANPEKAELLWSTNCEADSIRLATVEMQATQRLNTRSKADKTFHLVISFHEQDRPSLHQLKTVEDAACAALGLADHQRIVAYHTDTRNPHIHMAINLVHPVRFTVHEPYRAFHALDMVCAQLENELGFTPGPRAGKEGPTPLGKDMERHSGIESFGTWLQKTVKEPLLDLLQQDGSNWENFHQLLSVYRVEIRKRGNGLVFSSLDKQSLEVKASAVSRSFSIKSLEKILGSFAHCPGSHQLEKGERKASYIEERIAEDRGDLYQGYLSERNRNIEERRTKLSELRHSYSRQMTEVRLKYGALRKKVQSSIGSSAQKRASYSLLRAERLAERQRQWNAYRTARIATYHAHSTPTWIEYLRQRAEQGDLEALRRLRHRNASDGRTGDGLFSNAESKQCVFREYKYSINKTGDVTYFLTGDGGGQVKDCSSIVKYVSGDDRAIHVTILLAMERFGRRLELQGTEEFKRRVVEVAVRERLEVTFANREMEALRTTLEVRQRPPKESRRTRRV